MLLKKTLFAFIYLIFFALSCVFLKEFLSGYEQLFSFQNGIQDWINLSVVTILASMSFVLFAAFAQDWRIILPVSVFSALVPLAILEAPYSYAIGAGSLIVTLILMVMVEKSMRSYLTFNPNVILTPYIKNYVKLLTLFMAICFFFSVDSQVKSKGFILPETLYDTALKVTSQSQMMPQLEATQSPSPVDDPQPVITQEQIELLKQNPQLMEQYGLSPEMLDQLTQPSTNPETNEANEPISPQELQTNFLKNVMKEKIQGMIKPVERWIPYLLALLWYLSIISITGILTLLLRPLIWIVFKVLESTGYVKYETEMREVKKLTV